MVARVAHARARIALLKQLYATKLAAEKQMWQQDLSYCSANMLADCVQAGRSTVRTSCADDDHAVNEQRILSNELRFSNVIDRLAADTGKTVLLEHEPDANDACSAAASVALSIANDMKVKKVFLTSIGKRTEKDFRRRVGKGRAGMTEALKAVVGTPAATSLGFVKHMPEDIPLPLPPIHIMLDGSILRWLGLDQEQLVYCVDERFAARAMRTSDFPQSKPFIRGYAVQSLLDQSAGLYTNWRVVDNKTGDSKYIYASRMQLIIQYFLT